MKKIIFTMLVAITAIFSGCKTVPTPAEVEDASYAIGISTALVYNMTKINDADRQVIIDIMGEIKYCCPTSSQTMVEAWTEIAKAHVAKLIAEGKINEIEGKLILKTFELIASGCDYMIRIKWPKIGQYTDLVLAATNGFCSGFLTAFKPVNGFAAPLRNYDVDAYNYLMSLKR